MTLPTSSRRVLVFAAVLIWASGAGRAQSAGEELVGWWQAEVRHAGSSEHFALELARDDERRLVARLAIPAIDAWNLSLGSVQIVETGVQIGGWKLDWDRDARELSGILPASLVPIHEIPFVLRPSSDPTPSRRESRLLPSPPTPSWTVDVESPVWAGLAHSAGTVLVADDAGTLRALEADDGAERWRFQAAGALRATPTVVGGWVWIVDDSGVVSQLALDDGALQWSRSLDEEPPPARVASGRPGDRYDHFASSVAVDGERLLVGCAAGHLHALARTDGGELWRFSAEDAIRSTPAVANGHVVFGSFDGRVYAVDAESGTEVWRHETGAPVVSSAAIVGNRAVVGSRTYELFALELSSGEVAWTHYRWFSWIESSAVHDGDDLYVGSSDAQVLHSLDPETGELRWVYDTGGSAWSTPAVSDELVFIGSVGVAGYIADQRGGFHAVDRRSGAVRWALPVEGLADRRLTGFAATPVVGDGQVFAAGLDGVVRAFPL